MKKLCILALFFLSLVSCSSLQFKYSALNYTSYLDGIYMTSNTVKVPKTNHFNNEFKINSDFYFNTYNRYSWQYPYYGWNYNFGKQYFYQFNDWYYRPPIYYNNYLNLSPSLNRVKVRGTRGSTNINRNDQTSRHYFRSKQSSEGNSNGRRSGSR
jgi:hypothetical protein